MPYSSDDISNLPENVQKMEDKDRRQWCRVWNSAYEKHSDEGLAFREANGVLKKEGGQPNEKSEKGFSLEGFDGIELADPLEYDPEDPKSIEEFISKEIGLPIEIKGIKEPPAKEEVTGIGDEVFTAWLGAKI